MHNTGVHPGCPKLLLLLEPKNGPVRIIVSAPVFVVEFAGGQRGPKRF